MGSSKRVRGRSSVALALGALLALAVTAAAFSAVPGLEHVRVTDPDVPNSINHKVAGAPCPDGKRVVGAGGSTSGNPGQRGLTGLLPDATGRDLVQVNAVGDEDQDGDDANWRATAVAICAEPLDGLELVEEDGVASSGNKTSIASCPPGKQVVGTGGDISRSGSGAPLGDIAMDDLTPSADLTEVAVTGAEDQDGTEEFWRATAYAICAEPLPGLERVVGTSPTDSGGKSARARCTAGRQLVGTGADITNGKGQVRIQSLLPHVDKGGVTAFATEDQDGTTARWTVRAYAICANNP